MTLQPGVGGTSVCFKVRHLGADASYRSPCVFKKRCLAWLSHVPKVTSPSHGYSNHPVCFPCHGENEGWEEGQAPPSQRQERTLKG